MLQMQATKNYRPSLKLRAAAELELRRRRGVDNSAHEQYRFEPAKYIVDVLKWYPWAGEPDKPGQVEVLDAYALALRQQHERNAFEQDTNATLTCWQPGQTIQNRIRVDAGHTVGKTKMAAGIVSHFIDCFKPSIVYTFAPSYDQINDLLWKEIRRDRRENNLSGRVLDTPELKISGNHFAKGKATDNSHGSGTERVQGQHGKYLMFVIDEAEGVADYVYDAIESMTSGGISIVLMLANPRTRTSTFYKQRTRADVVNFRISCLYHPNVVLNTEVVPGAVRRGYVESMVDGHCEVVERHDPDKNTFELPWQLGVIYQPDSEFMFRVLGIAPANMSDRTFVPTGRVDAARLRKPVPGGNSAIYMGIDVARFGNDMGTLYVRHGDSVWRARQFSKQDTTAYWQAIKAEALQLKRHFSGIHKLHVRVDGGGGFGGGVIDPLRKDMELRESFSDFGVYEVNFGAASTKPKSFDNLITEIYAEASESLKGLALFNAPSILDDDLTEREFEWVNRKGVSLRRLTDKEEFRKKLGRSPDDGDGFCLAVAPDFLFTRFVAPIVQAKAKGW